MGQVRRELQRITAWPVISYVAAIVRRPNFFWWLLLALMIPARWDMFWLRLYDLLRE